MSSIKKLLALAASVGLTFTGLSAVSLPAVADAKFTDVAQAITSLGAVDAIAIDGDGSHALLTSQSGGDGENCNNSGALRVIAAGTRANLNLSGPWSAPSISANGLLGYAIDCSFKLFQITDANNDGNLDLLNLVPMPTWNHDGDDGTTPEIALKVFSQSINSDASKMIIETDGLGLMLGTRTETAWSFEATAAQPSLSLSGEYISELAVSENGSQLFVVSDFGRVVKSTNAGATWAQVMAPKEATGSVSMAVSGDGLTVAVTYSNGAVVESDYSIDGGSTWASLYAVDLGLDIKFDDGGTFARIPSGSVAVSVDGNHVAFGLMGNPTLVFNSSIKTQPSAWQLIGTSSNGFIDLAISSTKSHYGMILNDGSDGEVRIQSTQVTTFDGAWAPSSFPSSTEQSFSIMDGETSDYVPSHVRVTYFSSDFSSEVQHLCDTNANNYGASADVLGRPKPGGASDADYPCSSNAITAAYLANPALIQISGRAILEPCPADPAAAASGLCIESVSLGTTTLTPAAFDRLTAGPSFVGEEGPEGLGKFPGGNVSLWTSSTLNSAGTGTYAANVAALMEPIFETNEGVTTYAGLKYTGISGTVTPFVETSNYGSLTVSNLTIAESGDFVAWSGGDGPRCAFAEDNVCGRIVDFAPGTKVKLEVRVPKTVGGFFKGRMKGPRISVTSISDETQRISAEAEFVTVPRIEHTASTTFLTGQLDLPATSTPLGEGGATLGQMFIDNDGTDATGNLRGSFFASSFAAFDLVNWLKQPAMADDTVSGFNTLWSFGTVGNQADPDDQSVACLADTTKVLGVVTSNAMVFQDAPPYIGFDSEGNTILEYQVGGMHFEPDGTTPVQGTYDMILESAVARCLYPDLASVPQGELSADITISETISETTTPKAATVSVAEAGGWLSLSAYDFTFSTNDVQVSLKRQTQQGGGTGVVTPVVAPTSPVNPTNPLPAGATNAVLIGGVPVTVDVKTDPSAKTLDFGGAGWGLKLASAQEGEAFTSDGKLIVPPSGPTNLSGSGFKPASKVAALLIPISPQTIASAGGPGNFATLSTATTIGELTVAADGSFTGTVSTDGVAPGNYALQINGLAADDKLRSISIATVVPQPDFKVWTKRISETEAKIYARNPIGAGKVQFFVNGKEVAWIRAEDSSDRKLRRAANGFSYLVRTINLEPGKNRIEIQVDGVRQRFVTYTG
jgi:hypothetical protein